MRKIALYFLFLFWLLLLMVQAWVWGNIQDLFVPNHPVTQMIAGLLQDTLWIPMGLAVPIYGYYLFCKIEKRILFRLLVLPACMAPVLWAFIDLPGYFRYLVVFIILYFIVFALRLKKQPTVRANVMIFSLALVGLMLHYQRQLFPSIPWSDRDTVSVLDYNIRVNEKTEDREQVLKLIERLQPDLIFIQEISSRDPALFSKRFKKMYPHQLWADRAENYNGGAILSRFPFLSSDNFDIRTEYSSGHINLNHVVVQIAGKQVHLLNGHLFPSGHAFIELLAGQRSLASFIESTHTTYLRRNREAERWADRVRKIAGRVIIAGDFNDTPQSRTYELFDQTLNNAFREAGWGLGATYGHFSLKKSLSPFWARFAFDFLRIDHVFVSKNIKVISAHVLKISISDHRAQLVKLRIE